VAYVRKLPSGKWQATVKHPSGKRHTKTDPLKKVVTDWASDLENAIRRGDYLDPKAGKITLSEWWAVWLTTRTVARATTAKNESHWRVHVQPAFGTWPLDSIQQLDVKQWVARMVAAKTGAEATATALRLLRQLLEDAVSAKKVRINPALGVKAPRPPKHVDRFLSIDEADRVVESVTKTVRPGKGSRRDQPWERVPDPANQFFVRLMLDAGLRWQEAAGLHHFRVDVRRRRIRVQEVVEHGRLIKLEPKSDAGSRWVPLTDDLVALYLAHVEEHGREGMLFHEGSGGALDYDNWLKRVWRPAVKAAAVDDPQPTPHDCRHSYGSWLADEGVPAHEIAKLMGHGSLRAAERYIHASEGRMERARKALGARRAHGGESQMDQAPSSGGENGA